MGVSVSCPPLPSSLSCFPPSPFPPLPAVPSLRSKTPKIQPGGMGSAISSPSGAWSAAPAKIEFGAFQPWNVTSGGDNLNDFRENQLTKSRAVYTAKANWGPIILFHVYSRYNLQGINYNHKILGVHRPPQLPPKWCPCRSYQGAITWRRMMTTMRLSGTRKKFITVARAENNTKRQK